MNFPWVVLGLLTLLRLVLAAWGHLSETESYLLLCSHHLDWGFVEGPAGIPALMRLSEVLLGNAPLAIRWLSPVFLLGASWVLWKMTIALGNKKTAFWVVIVFNLLPLANAAAMVMEGTMLITFCWLAAFYLAWELITKKSQKNKIFPWVLFGLVLAVGTQVTYQIGCLLPLVVFASLDVFHNTLDAENEDGVSSSWRRGVGVLVTMSLLALSWLPLLLWNHHHDWIQWHEMTWDSFWSWSPWSNNYFECLSVGWALFIIIPLVVAGGCCFSGEWSPARIFHADLLAKPGRPMTAALDSGLSLDSMDTHSLALKSSSALPHQPSRLPRHDQHEIFGLESPFFLLLAVPFFFALNQVGHEKIPFGLLLLMTALFLPSAVDVFFQSKRWQRVGALLLIGCAGCSIVLLLGKVSSSTTQESPWGFPSATGVIGAEVAAQQLLQLRTTYADTSGRPPFLIAETPGLAAILGAVLPIDYPELKDAPSVFIPESPALASQFLFWPHYADATIENTTPDPLYTEEKAVSPFLGHDAFYITTEKLEEIPQTISGAFSAIIPLSVTLPLQNNGQAQELKIYLCQNYQMLSL